MENFVPVAVFSPDRVYRYTLWRTWLGGNGQYLMVIGLNPSTADEITNDPTVFRCMDFAQRWGFSALCMTNLFAFRATDPFVMKFHPSPIGEQNDEYLLQVSRKAGLILAAWGNHGNHLQRDRAVIQMIPNLYCLRKTKAGYPQHPLYLPKTTKPMEFLCT